MKHLQILSILLLFVCAKAAGQTTLVLSNNTSRDIYVAYSYHDEDDGWVTRGWIHVDAYDEEDLDLDDYSGAVYIHGHASNGEWGNDIYLCTGGSGAFYIKNADKIRCEYTRKFTKTMVSKGKEKTFTFNP